ncbi:MAG: sigma-54-dependent Fis family transcriptional regulator [Methylotenera sp.]|uniref:sigma-54 interaction domain-containing protein n=1 Tax=Methylotenera sp. TaxID=2051956 RepID=UPI0027268350|nr:sigma-54-dependent Fis family transcriptional regulator [Methylotenera sp.]MDO9394268.1 sigma-54-dependent Fis family transcriptional regulator [Methylotenera sp.]
MDSSQISELLSYLDSQPEPRIVMDKNYIIIAANAAYHSEYGNSVPLVGRHCYEVSHHFDRPCDEVGESCPLKLSASTGRSQRVLHLHQTPRGEEHVDVELTPIHNSSGEIVYFVEMIQTIRDASTHPSSRGLVGRSAVFNNMLGLIERVAPSEASVLLLGESGTGKELVAQAVHNASKRANEPFVAVDCSGLTETLFESELFGYEKGAFTGATQRKHGLVESASGGTLFLDEVGDIPLSLQVKLLRLLETGTYRRVGGVDPLRADFRLVSATHRDLKQMVKQESFRKDLYYRISTFPIHLPSLSQRREDIPLLSATLLARISPERKLNLHSDTLAQLEACDFPGNIRELRNILERASLMADSDIIMPEHLALDYNEPKPSENVMSQAIIPLEQAEQHYLQWAVSQHKGDRRTLAKTLGISERTLYRKLQI